MQLPCRGASYLFCQLPEGHSRRKGAQGGYPRWLLAPVLPLPVTTAGPWPHLHGPVSEPMEKGTNSTMPHGAEALISQSFTTNSCTRPRASPAQPTAVCSLLPPCGGGGRHRERKAQKDTGELHKDVFWTWIHRHQRQKASYLSPIPTRSPHPWPLEDNRGHIPWQIKWDEVWKVLNTEDGPKALLNN